MLAEKTSHAMHTTFFYCFFLYVLCSISIKTSLLCDMSLYVVIQHGHALKAAYLQDLVARLLSLHDTLTMEQ